MDGRGCEVQSAQRSCVARRRTFDPPSLLVAQRRPRMKRSSSAQRQRAGALLLPPRAGSRCGARRAGTTAPLLRGHAADEQRSSDWPAPSAVCLPGHTAAAAAAGSQLWCGITRPNEARTVTPASAQLPPAPLDGTRASHRPRHRRAARARASATGCLRSWRRHVLTDGALASGPSPLFAAAFAAWTVALQLPTANPSRAEC